MNPIKLAYQFNKQAGLLEQGYSDIRECAFPIEEALEQLDVEYIDTGIQEGPKELSRSIMSHVHPEIEVSDVDRFDKHLDIIVFSLGSLFKLGLTPQQAMKGLSVVMEANMQKLTEGKDEAGKQKKPTNFQGPEVKLQKILDERDS